MTITNRTAPRFQISWHIAYLATIYADHQQQDDIAFLIADAPRRRHGVGHAHIFEGVSIEQAREIHGVLCGLRDDMLARRVVSPSVQPVNVQRCADQVLKAITNAS